MEYAFIKTLTSDRTGIIVLNRPEKKNALNERVISELKNAFLDLQENPDVKVIILKAEGTVFSAGADLAYLQQLQKNSYEDNLRDSNHLKELYLQIYTSPKPVVAQVQGHAIAGGCGLACICDFVFASNTANFGYTEVRIGFIPAMVMVFLVRRIGEGRARELLLSGNLVDAITAQQYGLINYITAPGDLESAVRSYANDLVIRNSASSMSITKKMINETGAMTLIEALDYAAEMNAKARSTADCRKGIEAFINKESIMW